MKSKLLYSLAFFFCLQLSLRAQSPQQMNYQAVVRNNAGQPVANGTSVKLRVSIHDLTATGTVVYTEVISTTANQFGLVNVQIGVLGNLATVNWGNGAKYLQVETDINNTGTYTDMGSSQLISVPYALYAANSNVGPQGPIGPQGSTGVAGSAGTQGSTGANGSTGAQGLQGATGATGTNGVTGATGSQGTPGNNGVTGAAGAQGATGTNGDTGATGSQGTPGTNGATGAAGPQGATGTNGVTGATGPQGITGSNGASAFCAGAVVNYITKFSTSSEICNSVMYDDGTNVGVGTFPGYKFDVAGKGRFRNATGDMSVDNTGQIEISNAGVGQPYISFHKEGQWGGHFGLDADSWFSTRGWSAGATGYTNFKTGAVASYGQASFLYQGGQADGSSNVVLRNDGTSCYIYPWGTPNAGSNLYVGAGAVVNLRVNGRIQSYGSSNYLDGSGWVPVLANNSGELYKASDVPTANKPIFIRRYSCNGCDNPDRNLNVSTSTYVATVVGFYPTSQNGSAESTRARVYANGGNWYFKGDLEAPSNEDWDVDIMFIIRSLVDDQRPTNSGGGGTGF